MRLSELMWAWSLGALLFASVPVSAQAPTPTPTPSSEPAKVNTDEEARVHFRLGTAYYDSGRFAQAAQEFKQAYELSKRPQLLYNLFLAYRDAGDIHNAATALRQYLADNPNVEERSKLEARLASLEKILEGQPAPQQQTAANTATAGDPAPATAAQPAPNASVPPADTGTEPDKLKWLPWTLIGAGGALLVGGIVTGALAKGDESDLEKKCPNNQCPASFRDEADDLKASGNTKAVLSDVLTITGAVTAGVGVAFIFWKPWRKRQETSPPVNVACGATYCGANWSGRF